jgi:hypothetical protein
MDQPTHIIDPDGEVLIHLRHANAPFAPLDQGMAFETLALVIEVTKACIPHIDTEAAEAALVEARKDPTPRKGGNKKKKKNRKLSNAQPVEAAVDGTVGDEEEQQTETRFCIRVSAKHLTLASPVFKKQLTGSWKESVAYQDNGSVEITTEGWDIDAFLLLLRIMHCQFHQIPKHLPLEMLAKVTILVDYYDCAEVMKFFTHMWLSSFEESQETPDRTARYSRDLILSLWIAWFYVTPGLFNDLTSTAMSQSNQEITNLGLPIPEPVIRKATDPFYWLLTSNKSLLGAMNDRRSEAINNVVSKLYEKHEAFLDGTLGCSFECSSIMYGALSKAMKSNDLLSPKPVTPFTGLNYEQLVHMLLSFESPHWYHDLESSVHGCEDSSFEFILGDTKGNIEGLQLSDHVSHIPWIMDI